MVTEIKSWVRKLTSMTDSEIDEFIELGKLKTIAAKSHFIQSGQIPTEIGIVISGLLRYVYISEKGKEFTKVFMQDGSFISSYSAMISGTPSHFFIEAIEKSEVFVIPYNSWQKLRDQNYRWNLLLVALLEKGYSTKEKRERELLLCDAQTRYRIFLEEHPTLEKRVTQNMIASYIGITPIALSRVRRNIPKEN
jgi:CRP-like cAMP-binding protein